MSYKDELTALISECLREIDDHEFFLKLESVLRQQQAEIEALKAAKIRAYNNGVEDGRKPDTNNEPVAWMETYKGEPNNLDWDKSNLNYGSEFHDVVPLYTHPVKELSRMDVYELAIESGFMLSTQYGEAEHKLMPVSDGDTLVKLARAILRKAHEK